MTTYKLTNNTQYDYLPNHQTTDHICSMIAYLSLHPDIYHLYLNLNKAFNSFPHNAFWNVLSNYNIPTYLINLIKNLYAALCDYPIVNGHGLFAAQCIRDLCQGCPMSPTLLNLLIDPILLDIKTLLPTQQFHTLFSFIDDIALKTKSPRTLRQILHFLFTEGRLYSLSFNTTKSELHALNNATHVTILISSFHSPLSTFDNIGNPRIFYKYLETYFFNQGQNTQMYQLLVNTIKFFFTNLSTLPLTRNEIIKLSNNQLIPKLTYRLIYKSLPQDKLDKLDSLIWTHISKSGNLSHCTLNTTKYSSNASFGLNITKIGFTTSLQTINHILHYSFHHGPKTRNDTVINAPLNDSYEPNLLQHMTASSANVLGYYCHNIPSINPCLPHQLPAHTSTEIASTYYQSTTHPPAYSLTQINQHPKRNTIWHLGTLDHPTQHKATATFPDMTVKITNNNRFRLPTNTTNGPKAIYFPTKPPNPPDTTSFPYAFSNSHFNPLRLQFTLVHNVPPPKLDHLHYWRCRDLRQAPITYPAATVCYTDGFDDPISNRPSQSAATFNTPPPITICNTPPIKGSFRAEIFAIVLITLFQILPTLPQPTIIALDNLSVCSTLQFIQQTNDNPFTASPNPFCISYAYIWTFLHSRPLHIFFTWIKGHADVRGNNYSDAISKWASTQVNYPPGSHQPSSTYFIYYQHTPPPGSISLKSGKHLLPAHSNNNIHLSMSRDLYSHTSWFPRFPFK